MSLPDGFTRVSKRRPCPICGRIKWCLVSNDDPLNPSRVICTKVTSPIKYGDAGHLHVLRDDGVIDRRPRVRSRELFPVRISEIESLHAYALAQRTERLLHTISKRLCVSTTSLSRLEMGALHPVDLLAHGFVGLGSVVTFPMRGPGGGVVGLRLRTIDGQKFAIPGSRNALFIPSGMSSSISQLLIAEGTSDAAALLDFGYDAIGRPSSSGAEELILRFVRRLQVHDVVVVMDGDESGRAGGITLAKRLRAYVPVVRAIEPPTGINDVRAWKIAGATRSDIDALIASTERVLITVGERRSEVAW